MPCDNPPPPSSVNESSDGEQDGSVYNLVEDFDIIEAAEDYEFVDEFEDESLVTFNSHKDSVFCCKFDKDCQYAVSGGQDDTAFVYSIRNKSVKFECTGHSESVVAAGFSSDSKYVATADMNGLVQVWNVNEATVAWNFEESEVLWLKWLDRANVLITGCSDGNCWKCTIPEGDTNVLANPTASCNIGSISHDNEKLATGYSDGTLKLWNVSSNSLLATLSSSTGHKAAIITIKYNDDDSLILTGSEDGTAKVIKASDFKVIYTITGCDSDLHEHEVVSIEDVGFCHSMPCVAVGTNCGVISIWDISTKTRRARIESNSSVIKVICDKLAPIVYVSYEDGSLQAQDVRSGTVIKYWHGHKAAILDLDLSRDCTLLLTASDDKTCKIFQRGIF